MSDFVRHVGFDKAEDALMQAILTGARRVDFLSYEEYGALNRLRAKFDLPEIEGMSEELIYQMSNCYKGCE